MRAFPRAVALALLAMAAAASALPSATLSFDAPVKLNGAGMWGYEPSIDVDLQGTLYATAHKASLVVEGTRLSSFLWYSLDGGATWPEMPSPLQAHDKLFAFEGDLAVDALDRLYYVDTYAADNTLSRWTTGPSWDRSSPVMPATGVDDRPWIAAHGDGIVYYMGNNGASAPSPGDLARGSLPAAATARIWVYASTDGGLTWTPGHALVSSFWCGIAASPVDDHSLFAACSTTNGKIRVFTSANRGDTWSYQDVFTLSAYTNDFVSAGYDAAGNMYTAFADVTSGGNKLYVARNVGAGWSVQQVTPFVGSFREVWVVGGHTGDVAVVYSGTSSTAPNGAAAWYAYATVSGDATAATPTWATAKVDAVPVTTGSFAPGDFFQGVFAPTGELFVAYGRDAGGDIAHAVDYTQDILVARQASGPNMG